MLMMGQTCQSLHILTTNIGLSLSIQRKKPNHGMTGRFLQSGVFMMVGYTGLTIYVEEWKLRSLGASFYHLLMHAMLRPCERHQLAALRWSRTNQAVLV